MRVLSSKNVGFDDMGASCVELKIGFKVMGAQFARSNIGFEAMACSVCLDTCRVSGHG
jgi:hypothetical protein